MLSNLNYSSSLAQPLSKNGFKITYFQVVNNIYANVPCVLMLIFLLFMIRSFTWKSFQIEKKRNNHIIWTV